ncbi:hypothetical protein E3N88_11101 [Mikania micrantha]|uniref:Uncharacterized protein n=1 Tax=Mikania micrantha TaxID=192012 RepID=A0A5N6PCG3_9ASTR|nr:hypothetical protein E3N88_11101 [Mikania micrantha]
MSKDAFDDCQKKQTQPTTLKVKQIWKKKEITEPFVQSPVQPPTNSSFVPPKMMLKKFTYNDANGKPKTTWAWEIPLVSIIVTLKTRDRVSLAVVVLVALQILHEHDVLLKNQQSAFLDLQRTVGDIAKRLDERPQGQFPGQPQTNPNAHVKAVTTRSGGGGGEVFIPPVLMEVEESERVVPPVDLDEEESVDEEIEMETPGRVPPRLVPASTAPNSESPVGKPVMFKPTSEIDLTRVPYPARLTNQKHAKEYGHFLDMFRQLKINLPFIEALQHIPKYVKFLKELLKGKDHLGEGANVSLSAGCSTLILNKLPEKLADPGMFTIPCLFGDDVRRYALADSGASINLMPYSLYKKLALGDLSPTRMTLSLADRSVKCPRGILKDVLVKVDKFVFPVDFVVMDMDADTTVLIILGRPFLRTTKAIIDVYEGKLTFRVGDESVCLKIAKSMSAGGELVHQVDGVILLSDELGVNEVMGGGPRDVGDRGPDLIAGEEVFNQFDAIMMNWSHQVCISCFRTVVDGLVNFGVENLAKAWKYGNSLEKELRRVTRGPHAHLLCYARIWSTSRVNVPSRIARVSSHAVAIVELSWKDWHSIVSSLTSNKHVYSVIKYKETSSRLGKDGPGNKKRRKLDSGFSRATRQPQQTLSRYARGGKDQNTLLNLSRYATDLEISVTLRHRLKIAENQF